MSAASPVKTVLSKEDEWTLERIIGLGEAVACMAFRHEDLSLGNRAAAFEALGGTIAGLARDLSERAASLAVDGGVR